MRCEAHFKRALRLRESTRRFSCKKEVTPFGREPSIARALARFGAHSRMELLFYSVVRRGRGAAEILSRRARLELGGKLPEINFRPPCFLDAGSRRAGEESKVRVEGVEERGRGVCREKVPNEVENGKTPCSRCRSICRNFLVK